MSQRVSIDLPAILQASTEIVDSRGVEALSLAALAEKLKIRPPSLYNHIHGLQGLRTALAVHGCDSLNAVLTRSALGQSGDAAVRGMADAYLEFARKHPGLTDAVQRVFDADDENWRQAAARLVDTMVQVFRNYGLNDEEAIHAVRGFRSLVHGFTSLNNAGGFRMAIDVNRSFDFLVDVFLAGLRKVSTSAHEE